MGALVRTYPPSPFAPPRPPPFPASLPRHTHSHSPLLHPNCLLRAHRWSRLDPWVNNSVQNPILVLDNVRIRPLQSPEDIGCNATSVLAPRLRRLSPAAITALINN